MDIIPVWILYFSSSYNMENLITKLYLEICLTLFDLQTTIHGWKFLSSHMVIEISTNDMENN